MQEAIKKSGVLIEALPYIKKFFGKVVVIKYGGSAFHKRDVRSKVLKDIVFMRYAGMKPVLVHGGGPNISERLKAENIDSRFIDGLRVTCEKSMGVVDSVLMEINNELVEEINSFGGNAFGLSGKENNLIQTVQHDNSELGYVGNVGLVDITVLDRLIETNIIPVISPVGKGKDNKLYNVNADDAASNIAIALKAEKFVLMTNVKCVLRDKNDTESLIHSLTFGEAERLIEKGIISGGMLPKIRAGLTALRGGVKKAHIVDACLSHALLLEFFTDEGIGTEIKMSFD
ncbi:MAG: acetylglutamate kinase [Candidatus Omnitrophica bacterium]|nr:acetylglutamate kinase [Candidatus Omnitrophota bacterium]